MFKYLPLLWANLRRRPLRMGLTLASIIVAFLLFGLMQTLRIALTGSPELAGVDRLVTMHKVSLIQSMPHAYLNRIRGVQGVKAAMPLAWFGGIYQDDRNQIAAMAVEADSFFQVYPDYQLAPEQKACWLGNRTGAIVGSGVAKVHGWNIGDTVPLRSNIWTKADGTSGWPVKICGIYQAANGDNQSVYLHYEYLNESRTLDRDRIGWVSVRVDDPQRSAELARTIDALFANSATERAFMQGFANQMGNIGALLTAVAAAVFFTMLLVTANTMAQSIRERINEIAVMKTLGFSNASVTALVFAEALLLTALGGAIGLGLAALISKAIGAALQQFFPTVGMPPSAFVIGAALIAVLGSIAAAMPSVQAGRMKIVDALRKV